MRISHFHPRAFSPAFTRVIAAVLCLAFLAPNAAFACAWDRDTMAAEADGRMDTLNAIVGNFDIYPAQYYEMRIERVTRELSADPRQLELYDDIAVASDRVGRSTDAIEWMARKREQLDNMAKPNPEAEYRYLANLGTFHAHRWVGSGANRDDLTDLERGRDLIADAIALNPDAHFGREKYQLMAIEWLIDPPQSHLFAGTLEIEGFYQIPDGKDRPTPQELDSAIEGFTGLVSLGAGAESVDIMATLGTVCAYRGLATISRVAKSRFYELAESGKKRSLHPLDDGTPLLRFRRSLLGPNDKDAPHEWFKSARAVAIANNTARTAYVEQMMARGEHPDTHPGVWKKAPKRKSLPSLPGGFWSTIGAIVTGKASMDDVFRAIVPLLAVLFCIATIREIRAQLRRHREKKLAAAIALPSPQDGSSVEAL